MMTNLYKTSILIFGIVAGAFGSTAWGGDWPIDDKVRGVCYQPIPQNAFDNTVTPGTPNQCWFNGSDVCTEQFSALYGDGSGAGVAVQGGQARYDVDHMQSASFNVIRMYDWYGQATGAAESNCRWKQQGPAPPAGGNGHLHFLDYCDDHGIKVIVPISNYIICSFPTSPPDEGGFTWQELTLGVINSCKLGDGSLHPAVHSFSVGNETDIPENTGCLSNTNEGLDRACRIVNYILSNTAVQNAGVMATIPISNRRNGTYPKQDESPFIHFENMRDGGSYTVGAVTSSIDPKNKIQRYDKFYNSLQAFQKGDEYVTQILEPYDRRFGKTTAKPKLIFTEWGYPRFVDGVCTTWGGSQPPTTDQAQADVLVNAMEPTWNYFTDHPNTLFRGICVFQWQDSRSAVARGCNTTFGLHKYAGGQAGTAKFDCAYCGGTYWTPGTHDIDPLREIMTTEGEPITEVFSSIWSPQLLGDLDGNGIVDRDDLVLLLSELGYEQHDSDFDRDIDAQDLGRLLGNWGLYGQGKP